MRRNRSNFKQRKVISQINITPFVDVVLVLLIIFMITVPVSVTSININLPKVSGLKAVLKVPKITILVAKNGEIWIEDIIIASHNLTNFLKHKLGKDKDKTIISIKGDQNVTYGEIIKVASLLGKAGFSKISLVLELE